MLRNVIHNVTRNVTHSAFRYTTPRGVHTSFGDLKMAILRCANGCSVSSQAGPRHYCTPQNWIGPYTHYELGFPSKGMNITAIRSYAEDPSKPYNTVYGWVPLATITQLINDNGGLLKEVSE